MPRPEAAAAARVVERVKRGSVVLRAWEYYFVIDALTIVLLSVSLTSSSFVFPCTSSSFLLPGTYRLTLCFPARRLPCCCPVHILFLCVALHIFLRVALPLIAISETVS
jgi:hypothetical protein